MSDGWAELQELKSKRDSRRKRLEERKKERQEILRGTNSPSSQQLGGDLTGSSSRGVSPGRNLSSTQGFPSKNSSFPLQSPVKIKNEESCLSEECFEWVVLKTLCDVHLPINSRQLLITVNKTLSAPAQHNQITNLLQKFSVQLLISIEEKASSEGALVEIISADHTKLSGMITVTASARSKENLLSPGGGGPSLVGSKRKAEQEESSEETSGGVDVGITTTGVSEEKKPKDNDDVLSLLSLASTRERENKRIGEEILELLSRPTAKEKTLVERFRSQGGNVVKEFCPHGTKSECRRDSSNNKPCSRLHFRKIIQPHTDETLGDCSFLNTCFHMETCKYVHYEVDSSDSTALILTSSGGDPNSPIRSLLKEGSELEVAVVPESKNVLFSPQWIFCDLRYFDMTVLGKFSVIMADPPWDIHMELPYGTLSDDEMRHLNIPALQDEGLIFLWVTGRAMELGRECLELWGYERVDELIWVKTNQLQRIIRTGRTGHWLNHGKEHCLVGMKGNPPINRGLDCDVIVAEVRATSHKPDEIYGIIERLSPGTRKIELFGRSHNTQPSWLTLGNQLEGSHIVDDEVRSRFFARYPDGNCIVGKSS